MKHWSAVSILVCLAISACSAAELAQIREDMRAAGTSSGGATGGSEAVIGEVAAKRDGFQVGQIVRGSLDRVGEVDVYPFQGRQGQEVVLYGHSLTTNMPHAKIEIAAHAEGAALAQFPLYPHESLHHQHSGVVTLREDGTHFVRMRGFYNAASDVGAYRFQVRQIDRAPEKVAARFSIGDIVSGESLDEVGDIDEFTFEGRAGQQLMLYGQTLTTSMPQARVDVLPPGGNQTSMASVTLYPKPYLEDTHAGPFLLRETGVYTVRVQGFSTRGSDIGAYRFQVRLVQ